MILSTPRLMLSELTADDLPALRTILQGDETMRAYDGAFDEAMVQAWLQRMIDRYREHGFGLWAVVLRETGAMIGQCGMTVRGRFVKHYRGVEMPHLAFAVERAELQTARLWH